MKKILLALVGMVVLAGFLSQAFAREEGKVPPAYNEKAGHRQEKAFFIKEIKPGVFINQAVLDYLKGGGLCTAKPSCGTPFVLLGDWAEDESFPSYGCSLSEEIKSKYGCAKGWEWDQFFSTYSSGLDWDFNSGKMSFKCYSECHGLCEKETEECLDKDECWVNNECVDICYDKGDKCNDKCPTSKEYTQSKKTCPFGSELEISRGGDKWTYTCIISDIKSPCNQCNSIAYGGNGIEGSVYCGVKVKEGGDDKDRTKPLPELEK